MSLPRPEYPRPQLRRSRWLCLNGEWTFAFDFAGSGSEQGWAQSYGFDRTIQVPFCPESPLSGVGYTDFIPSLWYHRTLEVPESWEGSRIHLNFGGVDYRCVVYLDGERVAEHWGGSVGFTVDLTPQVRFNTPQHLVVQVEDHPRTRQQPCGKQSLKWHSHGCYYTRVTGIWQTVWLEPVASCGLETVQVLPDWDTNQFHWIPRFWETPQGATVQYRLLDNGRLLAETQVPLQSGLPVSLTVPEPRSWSPDDPFLYDWEMILHGPDGAPLETVTGYAGLRKIHWQNGKVFLNNEPLYLRLVLDQGYFPEGLWTAPSDDDLLRDIELGQAAGFHGARLHQKVFEDRYHYWADRLGYLTWAEAPSWGLEETDPLAARNFLSEWRGIVEQVRNHPSIVAWTPLNETQFQGGSAEQRRFTEEAYALTRQLDPTRPINDASGWVHVKTDLWTVHCYQQQPEAVQALLEQEPRFRNYPDLEPEYAGQPYLVDEFGGIFWKTEGIPEGSWGYGEAPQTLAEFYERLEGLIRVLLEQPHVVGYCYTQLTDVEQECNGLYTYHRQPKFDLERIAALFRQTPPAA